MPISFFFSNRRALEARYPTPSLWRSSLLFSSQIVIEASFPRSGTSSSWCTPLNGWLIPSLLSTGPRIDTAAHVLGFVFLMSCLDHSYSDCTSITRSLRRRFKLGYSGSPTSEGSHNDLWRPVSFPFLPPLHCTSAPLPYLSRFSRRVHCGATAGML